jgi:hypothetical protein
MGDLIDHRPLLKVRARSKDEPVAAGEKLLRKGSHFLDRPTFKSPAGSGVDEKERLFCDLFHFGKRFRSDREMQLSFFPAGEDPNSTEDIEISLDSVTKGRAIFGDVGVEFAGPVFFGLETNADGGAGKFGGKSPPIPFGEVDDEIVTLFSDTAEKLPFFEEAGAEPKLLPPPIVADELGDSGVPLEKGDRFGVDVGVDLGLGKLFLKGRKDRTG